MTVVAPNAFGVAGFAEKLATLAERRYRKRCDDS
jgi:hypothetical protein